jgi:DNA-binding beta-propeller fold protein YncE
MENAKHDRECTDCDLETTERLNYFTGQFLTERDFRAEQEYQIGKHRQHNRYLHGYGTVCGLKIVQHPNPDCQDRFVILEPGLALDCCGREIVVKEKVYIDLVKLFAAQNIDLNSISPEERNHLLFSLCYEECKTEFVPALYSECGCDEFGCDANRIVEGFGVKLQLLKDLPKPLHEEPDGVNLDWITTLSLENAVRVVIDAKGERIYVLTSVGQDQILVYDTKHHCLLKSIPIEGQGIDLAIDPTGKFLYVIRHISPNKYFLRVIVSDLNNYINGVDLPLADGDLINLPQVEVSKATDGRIYTLDPHSTPKKVTIWKDTINSLAQGATPVIIEAAKFVEVTPTNHPSAISNNSVAIAVSPNGTWLFIADSQEIRLSKVDTLTLPAASQVAITIPLGESPKLLAVSGNSQRLYVVTVPTSGDKKIRAFNIQDGSPPTAIELKATGTTESGIKIGTDTPIAIAVSPSGKWAYVLLKTSDGKGIIKVIDGDKIATAPDRALSESVTVVSDPQDLVLDPEQQRIYVAGKGNTTTQTCGGVSVIDVKSKQCSEVIWKALDGCPECPDDNCVTLAIVVDYVKNYRENPEITNDRIENRKYRPLVTSTETLKQLIMCALETGRGGGNGKDGTKGEKGDPGLPGIKGEKGDPGEGLEDGLTQIKALSWDHNTGENPFAIISSSSLDKKVIGIVIAFTNEVLVSNFSKPFDPPNQIDSEHVFQVLIEHDPELKKLGIVCRCPIKGRILPVTPTSSNGGRITEAKEVAGPMADAAAFIFDQSVEFDKENKLLLLADRKIQVNEILIRLHGDFVIDKNKKAIDSEFVRAELPTGDRPSGSKAGIQGGVFESWFWIGNRTNPG